MSAARVSEESGPRDEAARAGATPALVVFHTAGLAVMSFLMSANGMALPQLFYQKHHAPDKVLLLAACLFAGTIGSITGVMAARRFSARRSAVAVMLAVTFAAEGALFFVTGAGAYAALNAAAQLGANYLMNHLDHDAAAIAGDRLRRLHDGASTAVRLVGMLAAPALFAAIYGDRATALAVLAIAGALAIASASSIEGARLPEREGGAANAIGARPVEAADRLLFGFAVCVYIALYLLSANLIYLLRDVLVLPNAERRGGIAIAVVFVSALVANACTTALRGPARRPRAGFFALIAPLPIVAVAAAALALGTNISYGTVLAGGVVIGASYGVFLAEVRDRASRGAREGKPELLSMFNNMSNVSSLCAFALMMGLAALRRGATARTYGLVLVIVGALPWAGLPLLIASSALANRRARS